jgi:transposase
MVLETARRMKVNVLFSAPYSPWLNAIEGLFNHLKKRSKAEEVNTL